MVICCLSDDNYSRLYVLIDLKVLNFLNAVYNNRSSKSSRR